MDLTKPNKCDTEEQEEFKKFVKTLGIKYIKKILGRTSEKCLKTINKTDLNENGLDKLKDIFPEIDKPITHLTPNQYKFKRAAQKIQAVTRIQKAIKKNKTTDIKGGKRKSKKRHYKPIIKTKTIRKKMLKRRRTKKRDKKKRQDK